MREGRKEEEGRKSREEEEDVGRVRSEYSYCVLGG